MGTFLEIAAVFLLLGFCLLSLVSIVFGLPGTFAILGAALVYGWATGFAEVSGGVIAALAVMAVAAEGFELWAGTAAAAGARPTRRVTLAVLGGGLVGGIVGTPFLFGVGSLLGALLGAFTGAGLAVASEGGSRGEILATAAAAFRGRLLGFIVKAAVAVAMFAVVLVSLF